jgi:hypothetical protein
MAHMITKKGIPKSVMGSKNLSVRELITLLKLCPDQDAWVVVPDSPAMDDHRHDPFRSVAAVRATDSATVELVATPGADAESGAKGLY